MNLPLLNYTPDLSKMIEHFIRVQDVKESSRELYRRTLKIFMDHVNQQGKTLDRLTRADVINYKEYLLATGKSTLTVSSYITVVRKFYDLVEAEGLGANIARGVKTPRRKNAFKKQHLTETQCAQLLEYYGGESLRNYAIVNLMLRTGLRCCEIVRADVGDITYIDGHRVLKVLGKGRDAKDEVVILTNKAWLPIKNYLATRHTKPNSPLFASESRRNTAQRLTTRTISGIVKDGLVNALGIDSPEFTAHSLRHTTAVTILKQGGTITDAQDVLRHSNPATTQIYIESIKREIRLNRSAESLLDGAHWDNIPLPEAPTIETAIAV